MTAVVEHFRMEKNTDTMKTLFNREEHGLECVETRMGGRVYSCFVRKQLMENDSRTVRTSL